MKENSHRYENAFSLLARHGVFVVLMLLLILFSLANKRFCTLDNFFLILQQASPLGIAVVGMVFVLLTGGIDISIGRSMFVISTLAGFLISNSRIIPESYLAGFWGPCLILGFVVVLGSAVGFFNGVLVARFHMLPFIVTLATGSILKGVGLKISGSTSINFPALRALANGHLGPIPNVLIFFMLVVILFDYTLRRTAFGRHLMAIGDSAKNAGRAGINVNRNVIMAYIICGALGAVGGILSAGQIGSIAAGFGEGNEFIVISAAVMGGASLFGGQGNIFPGAVIGIILITTIMNGLAMMNASPFIYTIIKGLIIFFAIAMDSIKHQSEMR
jgi:ribose/xylose/arabinose/galactoside ABC-type transport system permease subunit